MPIPPVLPDDGFVSFARRSPPVTHVLVYGTLRRGGSNDITLLTPAPRYVGTTLLSGTLHDLGAYPGLVLRTDMAPHVQAEVWAITPELERQLDAIEGIHPQGLDEYAKRVLSVEVDTDHGHRHRLDGICYEINPACVRHAPVIADGDWMAWIMRRAPRHA